MNKTALLVSICVSFLVSCSMSENPEPEMAPTSVAAPIASAEPNPSLPAAITEPATVDKTPPVLNREEIRRLQIRLNEVGFNPGSADGVAGPRTKAAFVRFQSACSKWQATNGKSTEAELVDSQRALPVSKQDVRLTQTRLRSAGFDSGPVDGVFGARTRAAWQAVTNVCPTIGEFAGILAYPASASAKEKVVSESVANGPNTLAVHASNTSDGKKPALGPQPRPSHEETRILQLRLRDAGFDPGPFDGVMGPKTKSALQQYEASQRGRKTKINVTASSADGHY